MRDHKFIQTLMLLFGIAIICGAKGAEDKVLNNQTPAIQGSLSVDQRHEKFFVNSVRKLCSKYELKEIENRDLENALKSTYGRQFYNLTFMKNGYVAFNVSNLSGSLSFQAFSEPFSKKEFQEFGADLGGLLKAAEH